MGIDWTLLGTPEHCDSQTLPLPLLKLPLPPPTLSSSVTTQDRAGGGFCSRESSYMEPWRSGDGGVGVGLKGYRTEAEGSHPVTSEPHLQGQASPRPHIASPVPSDLSQATVP